MPLNNLSADEQRQVSQQTCVQGLGQKLAEALAPGPFVRFKWDVAPLTKSTTNIGTFGLLVAAQLGYATGISQPDICRNLRVTVTLGAGVQLAAGVTVTGKDISGQVITELFAVNAQASGTTVTGTKCFASITSVDLPARAQANDVITIGYGDKLGINALLQSRSLIYSLRGTVKPIATADAGTLVADNAILANNGYTPSTVPDGTQLYRILVLAERD